MSLHPPCLPNLFFPVQENNNAAWYYQTPLPAAANIKDHIAFWKGVKVEV